MRTHSDVSNAAVESADVVLSCSVDLASKYPNMEVCLEDEAKILQQDLKDHIERCLSEAKASVLQCKVLLLPCQMTAKVSRDILRSSSDEPCGLRGASIGVFVETDEGLKSLGEIFPISNVIPTFELSVVFKSDKSDCWPSLKSIFDGNNVLKLKPEYKLIKRKLYSSASPVIHEFN
ncbi:DNA damage-inducible transcript 4-like protein isoform X2 [Stigmatopora nigra]